MEAFCCNVFQLTLYFSATGNTKFIAEMFSSQMGAYCLSIDDEVDFASFIKANDTIAFCYPIYGSRVPRILREFVIKYMADLTGKKIIVFVTQVLFSGDGARVFTDMFWEGTLMSYTRSILECQTTFATCHLLVWLAPIR